MRIPMCAVEQHIVVASRNPAKINAAKAAVERCFPTTPCKVYGLQSTSGVPDQPISCEQTMQGAINRIDSLKQQQKKHAWPENTLLLAVEGGVQLRNETELRCFAWAAVQKASASKISTARSAEFLLPAAVSELVLDGMELGAADDQVFSRVGSGQGTGTVGYLTGDIITRSCYYEHALVMALIPYMNPELYPEFN